jgi:propanediol utilization protein
VNDLELKLDYIVEQVIKKLDTENRKDDTVLVEASGRHVHLSKECVEKLFGEGYELTKKRELSQPGEYLCEEKVTLIGPKGVIQNVSVLGPTRSFTQVELSKTDAIVLGINAPVRISGDIKGSAPIIIATSKSAVKLEEGAIIAKRHIHVTLEDAERLGIKNKDSIRIEVPGDRGLIFDNVVVRISNKFKTVIHIDYDEANACGFYKGMRAKIIE